MHQMRSISIVIPTLNEEGNIRPLIARLSSVLKKYTYEIIFIDDHSSDRTVKILQSLSEKFPIKVFLKQGRKGKAQSLLEGFKHAQYDLIGMLDADLQYAPEELPLMIEKLGEEFDVVQSCREDRANRGIRKFISRVFNFLFIRVLHGLNLDSQSALKVFRKQIIKEINVNPTPWTFDLEFLIQARYAGYKITTHPITFEERFSGESKINVVAASLEIGLNALKLKFKRLTPFVIASEHASTMRGAGHAHAGQRFITHSTLPHNVSAIQTIVPWQKFFIAALLAFVVLGFYLSPLTAAITVTAILSIVYFLDVLFNFYLITRSLNSPPELKFSDTEIAGVKSAGLPVYSILCPLYKEAHVLPGFLEAISKLDWPKAKLDVLLLLEANDKETIDAAANMDLPDYVRVVVVPHSLPKTKPKACNYGLTQALGEYLVIYDAEDVPEPSQLKKAYLGFKKVSNEVKCLQAKLNFFNPHDNLQTRFFTAEYSLWFDMILPGLQSINSYIPLGGTSNHFRTADLHALHGWDPFNVTEDCDLGARLFKRGWTTAIIDSVTLEEANSDFINWIRQRSRWIKGYMQTYLVHMRQPVQFFKDRGMQAFVFQLVVAGKITFLLINPFLWLATISYFVLNALVGPTIESLYPPAIFYIAAISLIAGNFLYLYYYMIGCAKRGHWALIKYVFLVPIYWLMASIAAVMALYQLIVKPHFWEKTNHGLRLKPQVSTDEKTVRSIPVTSPVTVNMAETATQEPVVATASKVTHASTVLLVAMMTSNFLNFLYNAFLGRFLGFEQLGVVTLINTFWTVIALFISSLASTVNHKVSYLNAASGPKSAQAFYKSALRLGLGWSVALSLIWIALSPALSAFFRIDGLSTFLLFTPVICIGVIGWVNKAYLQGNLLFYFLAMLLVLEPASKFAISAVLVWLKMEQWVFLSIPFSILLTTLGSYLVVRNRLSKNVTAKSAEPFPYSFFGGALMSGLSAVAFLSLDIILVKHFLEPGLAGEYVLVSLVGKMIYFFGSLPNALMITFVSRDEGLKKNAARTFRLIMSATTTLVLCGFVGLGVFGHITVPLLLGDKTNAIVDFLPKYTFAISLFTLANTIIVYHLARKRFAFPTMSLLLSAAMLFGIVLRHDSVASIVHVVFSVSLLGFALISLMHLFREQLIFVKRGIVDSLGIFLPLPEQPEGKVRNKRILVFNWRDTKHKFAGGAEVYIQEMARHWVQDGNRVTIFSGNDGESERNEIIDGVEIVRRGGFYLVYFWAFVYYMIRFRGQYDVVIDCQNGVPFFAPLYVKEPVFCVMHHVHQEIFHKYLPKPLALFASFLEKKAMPLVYQNTRFVTVSESTKNAMEDLGLFGAGIDIVHNGVDTVNLKPGKKHSQPVILYLGRLKAYKSVDVLVNAFKLIRESINDAKLVIAGTGDEEISLKNLVQKMGLETHVEFTGRINDKKKISLLQKAWVFVNPSYIEGWGITTIEANACATPVVASDVPGLRDSVRNPHTGFLVKHGDHTAFAKRIIQLLEDDDLRKVMGAEAVIWASGFDWKKTSSDFLRVINRKENLGEKAQILEKETA